MAFPINNQMSLYIPIVQKYHSSVEYFKNVFHNNSIGEVYRVDFVARNGGDPEVAKELSAFVYLDWFNNEFAYNWQKVILAKNPNMPAYLYHMVGPNYWILAQNMKPRTLEQVAEEKLWVLTSQTQKIEELERDNFKMKLEIAKLKTGTPITMNAPYQTDAEKIQKLEQQLKTSDQRTAKLMSNLAQSEGISQVRYRLWKAMIRSTDETITSLEQQLRTSDQKVVNLLTNIAQVEALYNIAKDTIAAASVKYENLEKEQVQNLVRKNKKIKKLESKLERLEERGTEDDFVLIQKLQETIGNLKQQVKISDDKVGALEYEINFCMINEEEAKKNEQEAVLELLHLKKCMPVPQPIQDEVQYSCNGCSTRVSFTTETPATKLHLCHDCFVKTGAWVH